jgi:polysaccharide export outer membrane protein
LLAVGLVLLSIMIAAPVKAQESNSDVLTIGDKVTVSVFGQTELSGDFVLDSNGAIQMPLVGRITIAGKTPAEAEEKIVSSLKDGFLNEAVVSLRIAELKPVYVMGEVRSPGAYPFRYGLKVLSAIALAGGYGFEEQSLSIVRSEFLLADERLRLLTSSQQLLVARRLRLEAERDGLEKIPQPEAAAQSGLAQLLVGEREIFEFQKRARKSERDLLSQQVARLQSEKVALNELAELAQKQVELMREQTTEYGKLTATGHGLRTVAVEREREYARARSDAARIKADTAKNETALGELTLRLKEADTTFMRRVVIELQETRQKLLEIESSAPIARQIYESRRRRLGPNEGSVAPTEWDIRITRQMGLKTVVIQAQLEEPLQPGDVVQINRSLKEENRLPAGAASSSGRQTMLTSP